MTEAAVVVAVFALLVTGEVAGGDWLLFAALAGLGVLQAELGRGVERVRRRVSGIAHINMTSVWTFAAVLVLPPVLTVLLAVLLYAHLAVRSWYRLQRSPAWRTVSNTAGTVIACLAGHATLALSGVDGVAEAAERGWRGALIVSASVVVYFVVGALVVIGARDEIARSWEGLFGGWAENALELATLCLGVLTGLALAVMPALAVAVVPPMLMLHRTVLVRQLQVEATTDSKTGVLNPAGWHAASERELTRAKARGATSGLLMIDLDHFKRLNDTHGHLAGDAALHAVAQTLGVEVRSRDIVGRYGGEEFVVLLPDVSAVDAELVAERIRGAVERLAVAVPIAADEVTMRVSASIGVAMHPASGNDLRLVLDAADAALYEAKAGGRNRVVCAAPAETPQP